MMVILLSAISLALMAALVYMIMSQTEISGIRKDTKQLRKPRLAAQIAYQLIAVRGPHRPSALWNYTTVTPSGCTGTSEGTTYPGYRQDNDGIIHVVDRLQHVSDH